MHGLSMSLSNIRIVLVEARHPGNIGAAARGMKTMGLDQLVLVRPVNFPSEDAEARAVGAADLLHSAVVTDSLHAVTSDCKLVVGVSARARELSLPVMNARAGGERIVREAAMGDPVAVLFGPERDGLTNEALDACAYQLRIPTSPDFTSVNLASAVQLVAYEIFVASQSAPAPAADDSPYPSQEELEHFYRTLEGTLDERKFARGVSPERTNAKLRRLVARARPRAGELRLLHSLVHLMSRDEDG
jgi:tRNA (cytidine32/uridine32-2'-O)-methyltransferase